MILDTRHGTHSQPLHAFHKPFVWVRPSRYAAAPSLTLTVQTMYPDRVLVIVGNLPVGQVVTISRRPAGSTIRTTVRGGSAVTMVSDALLLADAEAPYGVELTYFATVNGIDAAMKTITLTLSGSKVALSDAISGASAEVVIMAWPSKRRERTSSVFSVGGRNIVVSGQRGGFSGTIEVFTETNSAKNNLLNLLNTATSGILQIRQAGPYDGVDTYIAVLADDETRFSQDGSDQRRVISLDVVETGPWAPGLDSSTFTLQDIANVFLNQTLQELRDAYPTTLLNLAAGNFSS